ncbi:MAG: gliding motility protein GldN [Flavobacteriales bacterium]|nr:gliding motility protein GldN [Flavobacteriales bacterium]
MTATKYFVLILIFHTCFNIESSCQSGGDCFNTKLLGPEKIFPVKPLPIVDERDVMWHRRLWREIDLKEKINQLLYFPNEKENRNCCMYDLLYHKLMKGHIKAYDAKDDSFSKELSINEISNIVGDSVYDANGQLVYKKLDSREVVKYWLKEDWFYNAKYAKMEVRIIGICPVKIKIDKEGNIVGYQQLFWLYYPNLRITLNNVEAFKKEKEDDPRVSFDDIFINRMFDSYIIQKEGGQKQHLKQHKTELDIKLENEKTKLYYYKRETGLWGN